MSTWFITGATPGGFGIAYAEAALARGDQVAVTSRRPAELSDWGRSYGERALVLKVDVTDPEQVHDAVATAEHRFSGIDVLVNNAGRGWVGSVEGTDDASARRTFDLNFFAVTTVLRAVLPGMRRRRSGWVVTMSSVAAVRPVAGFGYYTAVKAAVDGLADALRDEIAEFGIRSLIVEPGAFRTNAYAGFADEPITDLAAYRPALERVRAAMVADDGRQAGDPRRGVAAVLAAMDEADPPARLVLGSLGFDSVVGVLEERLRDIRSHEAHARAADYDAPRELEAP